MKATPMPIPLMPEAARSVVTGSTEQLMLEMVYDSVTKGVTSMFSMANVLRYGQKMERLTH
jgi:hypothetical protein